MPISASTRKLFTQCKVLGSGSGKVVLSDSELFSLLHIAIVNLSWADFQKNIPSLSVPLPSNDYYQIPLDWCQQQVKPPTSSSLLQLLSDAIQVDIDFGLFYYNLCSLHKRRLKYQRILSQQPKPSMNQIGPRSLIEYGMTDTEFLHSWMIWRKWIFDIDNRVAQETGYLFEPILASCLGGESVGARNSPIKRLDTNGQPTHQGRQIDCYIGHSNLAYELKLRVTLAASGQGRFSEELSFPKECRAAGLTPVLLVLDSTPSNKLDELSESFVVSGGQVYIGDDAWNHMEVQAGTIMSVFLEQYIRPPLQTMGQIGSNSIQDLTLNWRDESIMISGNGTQYVFSRS